VQVFTHARANIFASAAAVVEDVLVEELETAADAPPASRPNVDNLARATNRRRMKLRPPEPTTVDFHLDRDFLPPAFVQQDIRVDAERHLVLATTHQLDVLSRARTWFLDGTFKVVRRPFTQLLSIHAFLHKDDSIKQVPLVFILMTRRRKKDYKVLRAVVASLPVGPRVKRFVLDFESGLWQALRSVFVSTNVCIRGCNFHWAQAVWRKVQELGLQVCFHFSAQTLDK